MKQKFLKLKIILGLILLTGIFYSCSKIIFREIKCRDFEILGEKFWFPLNENDSVVFVNSTTDERKKYVIVDKFISHTTQYNSDTGCGCEDITGMLLVSGTDSLWFNNQTRYIEDNDASYYEDIFFVIKGTYSGFYETARTRLSSYTLQSKQFTNVELFECKACAKSLQVKKVYRAENLGIISFELVNGELWINENLTKTGVNTKDSFEYRESVCE